MTANPNPLPEPSRRLTNELAAHGLPSVTVLLNALVFAEAERRSCTENDPGILKGMIGWGRGIRSLREQLRPEKWRREEPNSLPLVVSPDRKLAITIAAGDENTGREGSSFSRTKWDKGEMLLEWVSPSRQISLLDPNETGEPEKRPDLWILLVQRTETQVLAEISQPTSVTKNHHLTFGGKRFFLPPIPIDQTVYEIDDEDDDDTSFDVTVERL